MIKMLDSVYPVREDCEAGMISAFTTMYMKAEGVSPAVSK